VSIPSQQLAQVLEQAGKNHRAHDDDEERPAAAGLREELEES
jgi:hypothetical protein